MRLKPQSVFVLLGVPALAIVGYRTYGWPGVAAVAGGLVMWLLLHFTRMMQILKRAANRPVGHVESAVMLHARLAAGQSLLHVIALTRALGLLESLPDTEPEHFRWRDNSGASVLCVFEGGRLRRWDLHRPASDDAP